MNAQITFDTVSREIKTKISKLGKDALLKKYNAGTFADDEEERVVALHYINKRGQQNDITWAPTFGHHRSQMSEQEIADSEKRLEETVAQNRKKRLEEEKKSEKSNKEVVQKKSNKTKKDSKLDKKSVEPSEKDGEFDGITLTENEVLLLDSIWNEEPKCVKTIPQLMESLDYSVRMVKATLASLKHKKIVEKWNDEDSVTFTEFGMKVINGEVDYKAKKKYERSNVTVGRVVVEIDGKTMEKSAYVRKLLRENKNITAQEINEKLLAVGFNKIYHSELTRCKKQLGITTSSRGESI